MNQKKNFIDLHAIIRNYIKHWWLFAICLILAGLGAYVFVKKNPRQSMSRANLMVVQDDASLSMMNGLSGLFGADPYVQDEIFVIKSHTILRKVAEELGTNVRHEVKTGMLSRSFDYPDFPVTVKPAAGIADTLGTTLDFKIEVNSDGKADIVVKEGRKNVFEAEDVTLPYVAKTDFGSYTVEKTKSFPANKEVTTWVYVSGYDIAAEDLALEVSAEIASKKSNVIELYYPSVNSDFACHVLNSIMDEYNASGIADRNQRALKTASFIDERLAIISGDLNDVESNIQNYKERQGIIDVQGEASYNTVMKGELERKLISAQTQSELIKMAITFLSEPSNRFELLPVTLPDGPGVEAISDYNGLILERLSMLNSASESNRVVVELEQQIDKVRQNILTTLNRSLANNRQVLADLNKKESEAISKLGNVPTQERDFLNLRRQQEIKQQLYTFLLERREETAMLIANALPKGTIVDSAYTLSEPLGVGKMTVLAVALFLGLALAVVILYIARLLKTKFDTREEAEPYLAMPILGEICKDRTGRSIVVSREEVSSTSELFRLVRTNLQFVLNGVNDKVVLITSTQSGEGKSFISCNLSASLALLGKRTVLVGMDIRNPQLANYLDLPSSPGITQYLANPSMTLDEITQKDAFMTGLDIIVAGPIPPNPGELLTTERLDQLIAILRDKYDYVIIDSAPVGMVSDTFHLARFSDATIYVVRTNYTSLKDLRYLNSIHNDKRLPRMNVVINGSSISKGYGYGYGAKERKKQSK